MPLTRNQQAALQANNDSGSTNQPSHNAPNNASTSHDINGNESNGESAAAAAAAAAAAQWVTFNHNGALNGDVFSHQQSVESTLQQASMSFQNHPSAQFLHEAMQNHAQTRRQQHHHKQRSNTHTAENSLQGIFAANFATPTGSHSTTSNSTLDSAFSTPPSGSLHAHARTYSVEGAKRRQMMSMEIDSGSPLKQTIDPDESSLLRPIDTSSAFGSIDVGRSLSPPDRSISAGHFSPQSSISTRRHAGDSSIDTSIDSVSNSATTMSAVPSQASSSCDDFGMGKRNAAKIKTRLRNIDRKAICEAARDDPGVRQEDLAARFGIERSTVSKTLKNKDKWLAIEDETTTALIVKHRTGKFPALEEKLAKWIAQEVGDSTPVPDVTIKNRALQYAHELGLSSEQFKASIGWIDKFRERHRLPKSPSTPGSDISIQDLNRRAEAYRAGISIGQQQIDTQPDGPAEASTPERPRSTSDMIGLVMQHETPKASKRHYADMAAVPNSRSTSSIDASMARMHLPGVPNGETVTVGQSSETLPSHRHDDSGYAMAAAESSKRRKGLTDATSSKSAQAMHSLYEELRRTRSEHMLSSVVAQQQQQGHPQQQHDHALAVSAAARQGDEEARRIMQSNVELHQRMLAQNAFAMRNGNAQPQHLIQNDSDHAAAWLPQNVMEDRQVSLEEARESLDVVLAFLAHQPAKLTASDYFVLGNLQGQLSALAQQQHMDQEHAHQQHQLQQVQMHHAQVEHQRRMIQQQNQQQQQHHQQQQQQAQHAQHDQQNGEAHSSTSNLQLLGMTDGNLSLVNNIPHRN